MHITLTGSAIGLSFGRGWSIWIKIGKGFELDLGHLVGTYIKLPGIGAAHRDQFGWTVDRWSTLRRPVATSSAGATSSSSSG